MAGDLKSIYWSKTIQEATGIALKVKSKWQGIYPANGRFRKESPLPKSEGFIPKMGNTKIKQI
jgi:hypothetical protein